MCGVRTTGQYTQKEKYLNKKVKQESSYSKKWSLSADLKKFSILQNWVVVH